jgi:hypothetical protein
MLNVVILSVVAHNDIQQNNAQHKLHSASRVVILSVASLSVMLSVVMTIFVMLSDVVYFYNNFKYKENCNTDI